MPLALNKLSSLHAAPSNPTHCYESLFFSALVKSLCSKRLKWRWLFVALRKFSHSLIEKPLSATSSIRRSNKHNLQYVVSVILSSEWIQGIFCLSFGLYSAVVRFTAAEPTGWLNFMWPRFAWKRVVGQGTVNWLDEHVSAFACRAAAGQGRVIHTIYDRVTTIYDWCPQQGQKHQTQARLRKQF